MYIQGFNGLSKTEAIWSSASVRECFLEISVRGYFHVVGAGDQTQDLLCAGQALGRGRAWRQDTRLAKQQAAQREALSSLFLLGNPTYLTLYFTPKILLPAPTEHLQQARCGVDAETPP